MAKHRSPASAAGEPVNWPPGGAGASRRGLSRRPAAAEAGDVAENSAPASPRLLDEPTGRYETGENLLWLFAYYLLVI